MEQIAKELDFSKDMEFKVLGDIGPTIREILGSYSTYMCSDCTVGLEGSDLELPGYYPYLVYRECFYREFRGNDGKDQKIISTLLDRGLITRVC